MRALRVSTDHHAWLRGHGSLCPDVGCGVRRRPEGDVHVPRPLGPLVDASPRGDGADLSRVRRARHAPRAAAREALHHRPDVPLLGARERALPGALAGVGRGDRKRRSGDRCGTDPALRHASRRSRRHSLPPRAELDRLPRVQTRVPRGAAGVARLEPRSTRRADAGEGADEPAAGVRQLRRQAGRSASSARRSAEDRRLALRDVRRAVRGRPRGSRRGRCPLRPRADSRARARLLLAHDLGVRRVRSRTRTRRSRAAAATTTSSRRSAARRLPEWDSARGSSGSCSRWRRRRSARTASREGPTSSSWPSPALRGRSSRAGSQSSRAEGIAADADYAGRSTKGQFTQAARLGARTIVVVGPDGAILRASDRPDETIAHSDVIARLAP